MSVLDSILGRPGDAPRCKVWAEDVSVHWYDGDSDVCLCGARTRSIPGEQPGGEERCEESDEFGNRCFLPAGHIKDFEEPAPALPGERADGEDRT